MPEVDDESLPQSGWYAAEWLAHLGKRQADLIRDRGWDRSRVSKVVNGQQPYTRDDLITVAEYLGIEPFELLMPPRRAQRYRRLRETAFEIVAEVTGRPWGGPEELLRPGAQEPRKTGTKRP